MKIILLAILTVPLFIAPAQAAPATLPFFHWIAKPLYVTPRVFILRPRKIRASYSSESTFSAIGLVFPRGVAPSSALMSWKHVNSFSAQNLHDARAMGSRPGGGSYGEYLEERRRERYQDNLASSYLNTTVVVGTKFVTSDFATSELPPLFLHKTAPIMKNALELVPPPLTVTVNH